MNSAFPGIETVYFLGIGGIGMSGIARFLHTQGYVVSGYDKTPSDITAELEALGIEITYNHDVSSLPGSVQISGRNRLLIIYTPAIPADHPQLAHFKEREFNLIKRSEALGILSSGYKTIAVAGTHGKTTTSSIIAHILTDCGLGCNAFLGGIASNYNSNVLIHESSPYCVAEADEYDRSFLKLEPLLAVITSMDPDHLDIYGDKQSMEASFNEFVRCIKPGGTLFQRHNLRLKPREDITIQRYGVEDFADYTAKDIRISGGKYTFTLAYPGGSIRNIELGLPGRHNVENAAAAIAVALKLGIEEHFIRQALESYRGVKRRFETVLEKNGNIFIDDYAHHPEELRACILSARELNPGKKILGIFQPHLYSRTRDFDVEFAKSLGLLDEVILLPIYPARELPIAGIDSQLILNKIKKTPAQLVEKTELFDAVCASSAQVILSLGAGDIDRLVKPIAERLSEKWKTK
jgi:UDP-N-acetylmuramate--alanine ligase